MSVFLSLNRNGESIKKATPWMLIPSMKNNPKGHLLIWLMLDGFKIYRNLKSNLQFDTFYWNCNLSLA